MKKLRLLLYPFSLIYWVVTAFRNKCFDLGIKKSYLIPGKAICVGNLSVGGTGKSPHVSYLIDFLLSNRQQVITISRGYGRKTSGLIEVSANHKAEDVGDEPLMFKERYGDSIRTIVAERRKEAVDFIGNTNAVIILDDAYQHRQVRAGLNILLTTYDEPYFKDHILPAGNLREGQYGKNRADIVVVTKCPKNIDTEEKERFISKLGVERSKVFFSHVEYTNLASLSTQNHSSIKKALLVTGIANPKPLQEELEKHLEVELERFSDHYQFSEEDIAAIREKFDNFGAFSKAIVSSEKDYMRLKDLRNFELIKNDLFIAEIAVKLDREKEFNELILQYAGKN